MMTKVKTKTYSNEAKGYNSYPYPDYKNVGRVNANLYAAYNPELKTGKLFDIKSYGGLRKGSLPPLNKLDDIHKYIYPPTKDFKDLAEELGERIAIWSAKTLNRYIERKNSEK